MFHAVGLPWGARGEELRRAVCSYIEANASKDMHGQSLTTWIEWESGNTASDYVARLRGRMWGGAMELTLLACMLQRPIFVYAPAPGGQTCKRIAEVRPDASMPRASALDVARLPAFLCLLYVGRSHYMCLFAQRATARAQGTQTQSAASPPAAPPSAVAHAPP
jgi:hypothetical protein